MTSRWKRSFWRRFHSISGHFHLVFVVKPLLRPSERVFSKADVHAGRWSEPSSEDSRLAAPWIESPRRDLRLLGSS